MAREFTRSDRVSDFLRQELAQLIQQEIRDPRIGMVMVTSVDVSRDIHYAKVFVTIVGVDSKEDSAEAIDALNNAAGFLRTQLSRRHSMRATPKLRFIFDSSVLRGTQLTNLIVKARTEDKRIAGEDAIDDNLDGED